ncbi:GNAT family N-acetyltransferase [Tenacibaculum piscium]|uniref:GNAT family N-acetyltransferase n=1 Tax=Tenacibaculum piscium TaxID=1458515 RepID=UPI001F358E48|nr:GNAT family N-acetyltransferase [Tenacibaculum piscium]
MLETIILSPENKPSSFKKSAIVDFLYDNLEQYGDSKKDIEKAIDYSLKNFKSFGGFVMILKIDTIIKGIAVINQTGMGSYIPENILVYIAINKNFRGKGLGEKLMKEVIKHTKGDIALHVAPENPAKYLYEKVGFATPYLEMRLKK